MAFHVEVSGGMNHARVFNLDEDRLRREVLEPWLSGSPLDLGDQRWIPKESSLRIIEGPRLDGPDLAMGRGWGKAERSGEEATRRLLGEASRASVLTISLLAETLGAEQAVGEMIDRLDVERADWRAVRSRVLTAGPPGAASRGSGPWGCTVVVAETADPPAEWMFEAGLAIGALGPRAVVAQLGEGQPPEEFQELPVIRLLAGEEASLHALAERLQAAARA
jgi:hypothetical protein